MNKGAAVMDSPQDRETMRGATWTLIVAAVVILAVGIAIGMAID